VDMVLPTIRMTLALMLAHLLQTVGLSFVPTIKTWVFTEKV